MKPPAPQKTKRSNLDRVARHPAFVAIVSVVLGTWLFGLYTTLQQNHDSRRKKSIEFLEDTSKRFNSVLTDIFLCTQNKQPPADNALSKACNDLFRQRFFVSIESEAFLESKTFASDYDTLVQELEGISDSLYEPNPPYDQLQKRAVKAWTDARLLLANALSNTLGLSNSYLGWGSTSSWVAGTFLLAGVFLGIITWKRRT